jgi:hypothetical protein
MAGWLRYNRGCAEDGECDAMCKRSLEKEPGDGGDVIVPKAGKNEALNTFLDPAEKIDDCR